MKTVITFEFENDDKTSVRVKRDNQVIGRIWSEENSSLPYPSDESEYSKNSIQICGFDKMSEVWACGPFSGKKDCVIHFLPNDTKYHQRKSKEYSEYVKDFFSAESHEIIVGAETIRVGTVENKRDLSKLKNYNDWLLHNPF